MNHHDARRLAMQRDILLGYQHPYHNDIHGAGFLDFLKPLGTVLKPFIGPVVSAIGDVLGQSHEQNPNPHDQLMQLFNETSDPKLKLEILKMLQSK